MRRVYSEHDLISGDIEDVFDYIAKDSPFYAEKVTHAIYDALDSIAADPERFPQYFPKLFRHDSLRRVVVHPYSNYLVFYELTDEQIRVLYVHHGAREFEHRHLREGRA